MTCSWKSGLILTYAFLIVALLLTALGPLATEFPLSLQLFCRALSCSGRQSIEIDNSCILNIQTSKYVLDTQHCHHYSSNRGLKLQKRSSFLILLECQHSEIKDLKLYIQPLLSVSRSILQKSSGLLLEVNIPQSQDCKSRPISS